MTKHISYTCNNCGKSCQPLNSVPLPTMTTVSGESIIFNVSYVATAYVEAGVFDSEKFTLCPACYQANLIKAINEKVGA